MPRISVCILNWNGLHYLRECLPSVINQSCQDFELVIVDNGSRDGSVEYLHTTFPDVTLIVNDENRGFCGGANQAISAARGQYVLLLNNDTVLDRECLAELLAGWKDAEGDVIGLFPKVLFHRAPDRINTFGARWDRWRLWVDVGRDEPAESYNTADRTFGAYFVAPCFRRSSFESIGMFDETFFAQVEDFDVCYRANVLGYRFLRCPRALVYHKEHGSKQDNKVDDLTFLRRLGVRNLLMMILKNYEAKNLVVFVPWVLVSKWARSCVASVYYNGISTLFKSLSVHGLILVDVIRHLPSICRWRRQLRKARVLSDAEIWRL